MVRRDPAGRLFDFFTSGKQQTASRPAREVLATLLRVNRPNDLPLLHRRYAKLVALPEVIERELRALPRFDERLYLRWKAPVISALTEFPWPNTWDVFINKIDATTIHDIEWCSHALSEASVEPAIDENELTVLAEQIAALVREVRDSDLDQHFKAFAVAHLTDILEAIDDYPVAGVQRVREAVKSVLGGIVVERADGIRPPDTPIWRKIVDTITIVASLCNIGSFALQIEDHRHDSSGKPTVVIIETGAAPSIPRVPFHRAEPTDETEQTNATEPASTIVKVPPTTPPRPT